MTRWIGLSTLCISLVALTACKPAGTEAVASVGDNANSTGENAQPTALVEAVTLVAADFRDFIELNGVTEPIRAANVSAQMGGRIVAMDLEEGGDIAEGDEVLRINTRPLQASIDRFEVQIEQLDSDIERTSRLVDRGLGTEATLEQLTTQRAALEAGIDEIRVGMREARTRAPIGGTVVETFFEVGEFVGPGTPVARIIDIGKLIVEVGVPERDVVFLREDMAVTVRIEASGEILPARISQIALEGNTSNRRFPVEVEVDNTERHLRAGMRATVMILKRNLNDVVVIPRDVVVQSVSGSEVFVVEEGQAHSRQVNLGVGSDRYVVVQGGLSPGEQLVVRGQRDLVDRETVAVTDRGDCCHSQMEDFYRERQVSMGLLSASQCEENQPDTPAQDGQESSPSSGHVEQ